MIAVVMAVLNEADILEENLGRLRAEGIDKFYVCDGGSTDGTRDILVKFDCEIWTDASVPFRQAQTMNALVRRAGVEGAEWILPVDADEFWYSTKGTIADVLRHIRRADKLYVRVWHHVDREHRWPEPKMQKVAFRYRPGAELVMGNHEVNIPGGVWGFLECRELQFRSFEHYCAKIADRLRTLDHSLPAGQAEHYRRLAGADVEQLAKEWAAMNARGTVYDPL